MSVVDETVQDGGEQNLQFRWLEKNPGCVPEKQLSIADVPGEHGVAGVAGLRPDLER